MPLAKPRFLLEDGSLRLLANPMPDMSDYRQLLADPSPQLRELGEHDHYFETSYQRGPMDFLAITRLWKISWSWLPGHRMNTRLDELYDTESEAYAVLVEVMDRFYREVADDGAIPIALILPARLDIRRARRGDLASYTPLLAALAERGIETIDAIDAFTVGAGASDWRDLVGAHYTAEGNRRVANLLYERLAPKWADSGRVGGDAEDAPEP
jgi:hypothetical protein